MNSGSPAQLVDPSSACCSSCKYLICHAPILSTAFMIRCMNNSCSLQQTTDVISLERDLVRTIIITSRDNYFTKLSSCHGRQFSCNIFFVLCYRIRLIANFPKNIILLTFLPLDSYNSVLSYDLHSLISDHINRVSIKVYSIQTIE